MSSDKEIEAIFCEAVKIESERQRAAYLENACGKDTDLRARVELLLGAHANAGSFRQDADELAATIDQPIMEMPGTQIGPYRLLQEIGQGGMGVVYMAEQEVPVKRRLALKIIKPGMDSRAVIARFEAERQALAMMDHPNIARVFDAGTTDRGRPYFVMELVKGLPITQYCDQRHLTPKERLALFVPICQAADHAHRKGIIHRDIKPSNVLVTEYDNSPVPKIIDFGVAKAISQRLTEKTMFTEYGQIVGTLEYMSPEQAGFNRLDVDSRSDVYSLGVLLYELLTGQTPFDKRRLRSAAFDELLRIIREEEPPTPSTKLSDSDALPSIAANRQLEPKKLRLIMRGELDCIIMKAMDKDRSRRYENANTLAMDVENYLNGEAITARRPTVGYRLRRFARQKRSAFVTVAIVLMGIIGGLGISRLWGPPNEGFDGVQNNGKQLASSRVDDLEEWVLTVSQDPKNGGRFQTINDAMAQVKAGQTIRVLDKAKYKERIVLGDKIAHSGVTLEATQNATLAPTGRLGIVIARAPNVTVRGFQIQLEEIVPGGAAIVVGMNAPGTILENLKIQSDGTLVNMGIQLEQIGLDGTDPPVLIQNCHFDRVALGVSVSGDNPCKRIVVRQNRFTGINSIGVTLSGQIQNCQVVANVFERMLSAVQLKSISSKSQRILVANNSFHQCSRAIAVWGEKVSGEHVHISNNLILDAPGPDMVFVDGELGQMNPNGPNDGSLVHKSWNLGHNWREVRKPTGDTVYDKSWISPSKNSVQKIEIDVLSRRPNDPDFLRPAPDSELVRLGAGQIEPSLPVYVGALPPKEVEPWDWNRTWLAPPGTSELLTVSQKPEDGGIYRTIGDALTAAKPWATIRVMDRSEYPVSLQLRDPVQHRGIAIEAVDGAVIAGLQVSDVPFFVVRGFIVRAPHDKLSLIAVSGQVEGGLLSMLRCEGLPNQIFISISNVDLTTQQQPLVIRNCRITAGQAISIIGTSLSPTRGVCVRRNHVESCGEGIQISGFVRNVQLVGNIVQDCTMSGIDIEEFAQVSRDILVANNTIFECAVGLRVLDREPFEELFDAEQMQVVGNLFFAAILADMISLRETNARPQQPSPVDGKPIVDTWRIWDNWRDFSGQSASSALPLADRDHFHADWRFVSRERDDQHYMRPVKDSDLVTGGAGGDLPTYAGAVPPESFAPWDWDVTWRSRARRTSTSDSQGESAARE